MVMVFTTQTNTVIIYDCGTHRQYHSRPVNMARSWFTWPDISPQQRSVGSTYELSGCTWMPGRSWDQEPDQAILKYEHIMN